MRALSRQLATDNWLLYLGFDSSTQGLTAIVLEIDGDTRRIVFQHTLNFDRDFPEYGTSAGVFRGDDPREVWSSPLDVGGCARSHGRRDRRRARRRGHASRRFPARRSSTAACI